jgi:hypothetical protein
MGTVGPIVGAIGGHRRRRTDLRAPSTPPLVASEEADAITGQTLSVDGGLWFPG